MLRWRSLHLQARDSDLVATVTSGLGDLKSASRVRTYGDYFDKVWVPTVYMDILYGHIKWTYMEHRPLIDKFLGKR